MKKLFLLAFAALFIMACNSQTQEETQDANSDAFEFHEDANRFADIQILRYEVNGLDKLSTKQKELVYYLSEAALCGREIIYAQNYKHNLQIKRSLEQIYEHYNGDRSTDNWKHFEVYLKRIWFSNGIHHHYAEKKFTPGFVKGYLDSLIQGSPDAQWPLVEDQSAEDMWAVLTPAITDPDIDNKKVVKDKGVDKITASANNYYGEGVTEEEAIAHYGAMNKEGDEKPVEYGLNSRLVKIDGQLTDLVYKSGGLFGAALDKMNFWLTKAQAVAETEAQAKHIGMLIEYFNTGDLGQWDATNVQWVNSTDGDIDFILGFIEVYGDAIGYKGAFEGVIQMNDFDASERMKVMSENAQWFEDNSSIMDEHKKENVVGVSYKVVNVAMEAGDAAPSTPIGINLPNSNWIRATIGSKSVSLGSIVQAYNNAGGQSSVREFYLDSATQERRIKYSKLAGKMHTAMHEVIGHASGKINPGIGTPKETLKNYSNTLEEARADLVALYFIYDQKVVDLGLMPSLEVGMAEYDGYITNGLLLQLRRLEPGDNVEEDHMRNRQLVAQWCFEKGKDDNVIERKVVDGKTYFIVNDYEKLRVLFGELLREIQRIKSEGDYAAAEKLVEDYGVIADQDLLQEARDRYEALDQAPYSGFVQPKLVPVYDSEGNFIDLLVEEEEYVEQMMRFAKEYAFLSHNE
ncbi:MAG: dihydrofolate reductase [Bacteroidia bacterium]